METPQSKPPVAIKQLALKLSDEDRLALLKRISREVNKKSFKLPKKNCRHCYGRGFIGYLNGLKHLPVPCRCTFIKPVVGKRR
jgi:hypothetical protein